MTVINNRCSNQTSALLEQIRDLARRHRCLLSRLSNAELLADSIALDLSRIERQLETGEHAVSRSSEVTVRPGERGHRKEQLRILAD